jgi:hypothetical protein
VVYLGSFERFLGTLSIMKHTDPPHQSRRNTRPSAKSQAGLYFQTLFNLCGMLGQLRMRKQASVNPYAATLRKSLLN